MQVKDAMVKSVKTIQVGSTLKDSAKTMTDFSVGSLIVLGKDKKMVGIITESDILRVVADGKDASKEIVDNIMTKQVYYIKPDDDVRDAVDIMVKNRIKKLPVITGSALVGIITMTDIAVAEPKLLDQLSQLMLVGKRQTYVAG